MRNFGIVIVGGGVVGAAILHRLCSAGFSKCLLLEQHRPATGSTCYSGGIVRSHDNDSQIRTASAFGNAYYKSFADHTGLQVGWNPLKFVHILGKAGAIDRNALVGQSPECQMVQPSDLRQIVPSMRLQEDEIAIIEANAGWMDPGQVTHAWLDASKARGATVFEGVLVDGLLTQGGRAMGVGTSVGDIYADIVILANGAWLRSMSWWEIESVRPQFQVNAIQVNRCATQQPHEPQVAYVDNVSGLYGRSDGANAFLVGLPLGSSAPEVLGPTPPKQHAAQLALNAAHQRLNFSIGATLIGGCRSFDGYANNGRGLIGHVPGTSGLFMAAGFSGGGFKMAPWIAESILQSINGNWRNEWK